MVKKGNQFTVIFGNVMLLLGFWVTPAFAQSVAVTHCQGECPQYTSQLTANRSNVVIHHLYAAGINGETGVPDWSAYRLTGEAIGVASLLPRTWQPDRLVAFTPLEDIITTGEAEFRLSQSISNSNNPYAGTGAAMVKPEDRARLAPMTSFANTPYWSDLNNFSNMVLMPSALRLGPWLRLEQRINSLAKEKGELYVITGPLYLIDNLSVAPSSQDLNPAAYYKIVLEGSDAATFVFPENLSQTGNVCDYLGDYQDVEKVSGIRFFPSNSGVRQSEALISDLGCAN